MAFPGNNLLGYSVPVDESHQSQEHRMNDHKPEQRFRIPVACERCRKRKIKCSGPDGDHGCWNCRLSANTSSCRFHRVNSEDFMFDNNRWGQHTVPNTPLYSYGDANRIPNPFGAQQPYREPILRECQYPTDVAYDTLTGVYGSVYIDPDYCNAYQRLNREQISPQYALLHAHTGVIAESNFAASNIQNSVAMPPSITISNERALPMPTRSLTHMSDMAVYNNLLPSNSSAALEAITPQLVPSDTTNHTSSLDNPAKTDISGSRSQLRDGAQGSCKPSPPSGYGSTNASSPAANYSRTIDNRDSKTGWKTGR